MPPLDPGGDGSDRLFFARQGANARAGSLKGQIALTKEAIERHSLSLESLQDRIELEATKLVVASPPLLNATALREVLLEMDAETRELRATLAELETRKADRKEVVFRWEMDEWIDKRCIRLLEPVKEDLAQYKAQTNDALAVLTKDLAVTKGRLSNAEETIVNHTKKIGNLSARLLKAETALIDKAEQSELDAFVEVTHRFMGKTREHLGQHDSRLDALMAKLEKEREKLQAQVTANLAETRLIPPTIPNLEQFLNWVSKNDALQAQMIKLFERMNMLKKAYYASDASMPLKTQLQMFLGEDAPDSKHPTGRYGGA